MVRLTRNQVRAVDRMAIESYGIPGIVLMENAARAVAASVEQLRVKVDTIRKCLIFCGKGNNGGDGLAAARHLQNLDYAVKIILCCDPGDFTGDALTNYNIAAAMRLPMKSLAEFNQWDDGPMCGILIDAIYGTGFRPPATLDLAGLRYRVQRECAGVLSIDLPSGMDADTGAVDASNCISADMTVTFVAEKAGFAHPDARKYTGEIVVADIGAPREIMQRVLAETQT